MSALAHRSLYGTIALITLGGFQHLSKPLTTSRTTAQPAAALGPLTAWSEPVNLGPMLNLHPYGSRNVGISPDGLTLYFGSNRPGSITTDLDFWVTQRASRSEPWQAPQNLGPTFNLRGVHSANPNFSPDGTRLYFNSDRPGGCGGQDLWVTQRADVTDNFAWEAPVNLGCMINSAVKDQGPSYFEDSESGLKQLYFASERPAGVITSNIYLSTYSDRDGTWGPAAMVPQLTQVYEARRPNVRSDGLEVILTSYDTDENGDIGLLTATRATTSDAWSTPQRLFPASYFPSMTADGTELYFSRVVLTGDPANPFIASMFVSTRHRLP